MHVRVMKMGGRAQSVAAWCRDYGVPYGRVMDRLKYGWTLKDALTKPFVSQKDRNPKRELHLLADAHGLRMKTVYNRIERGWPVDMWFSPTGTRRPGRRRGLENGNTKPVEVDGEVMTMDEAAKRLGLSCSTSIRNRLKMGWSMERALKVRKHDSQRGLGNCMSKLVVVNGENMTKREAAHRLGLSSIRDRETAGWTQEDALSIPKIPITECYQRAKANMRRRELAGAGLIV